ncbi:hypothetical protein J8273_2785 [Carpediemonas membranifera]|uniref:Uncharacterized protein n=1 Tax=Carpediemonas membranifera TaxID=201153 RepID=A0A8J6EAW9_9EUKA|nr:hypothetical protein J8273_2785 [Carpediemonas membranifera]|eukprot:KAG9395590.1 hypothetical protein J8273_2785 [Carpediemonas membranifera]
MDGGFETDRADLRKAWDEFLMSDNHSPELIRPKPEIPTQDGKKSVQLQLYEEAKEREARRMELKKKVEADESKPKFRVSNESTRMATRKFKRDAIKSFAKFAVAPIDDLDDKAVCYDELMSILHELGYWRSQPTDNLSMTETKLFTELTNVLDPFSELTISFRKFDEFVDAIIAIKFGGDMPDRIPGRKTLADIAHAIFQYGESSRLTYRPKTAPRVEELPFRPTINPKSATILNSSARRAPKTTMEQRYHELMENQRKREEKLEEKRREKEEAELAKCSFHPDTCRGPTTGANRAKKSAHLRLFQLAAQEDRTVDNEELKTEAKELRQCTFKPHIRKDVHVPRPSHVPRGFEESVERAKRARREKERVQSELSRPQYTDESYRRSLKFRQSSEFKFASKRRASERKSNSALLYIDVNLPNGRSGRIGIHKGDDPAHLAKSFADVYKLDRTTRMRLQELVEEHVARFLPDHVMLGDSEGMHGIDDAQDYEESPQFNDPGHGYAREPMAEPAEVPAGNEQYDFADEPAEYDDGVDL